MSLQSVFAAVLLIGLLILAGKWVRNRVRWLRRLFLPSSIIAGMIALLAGPQVLGRFFDPGTRFANGIWTEPVLEAWSSLPGLLISVVFAALFLGKPIPNPRTIWKQAGPMVVHGQTLAWGQYVVGLSLVLFLLAPAWGLNPLAGALIEIGFEGGHGTAAGLGDTFRELGFADGADLALGLATIGVVMGVILGTVAINWAVWKGHIEPPDQPTEEEEDSLGEHENREEEPVDERVRDKSIEPLSIHLGFIGLSIGLGWLLLEGMIRAEEAWLEPLGWPELMRHIPLFPLAMIGGVIVQLLGGKLGYARLIDRRLMNRISGTSLDLLIVAALGALSLDAIGTHAAPFAILAAGGIAWNLFGFFVLARVLFPRDWVPNGLANFGQGMGMTVVGLLLVKMSDPRGRTGAMEAFGYKQLLFEPVVGGGLFTAASLPLIYQFGPGPVLLGVTIAMLFWLGLGWVLFRRRNPG
ncbi:MAG: sodium:glutamate symporter [Puniceicoccaceae bacterium]|nr:MAG: sodium:glutamate symporter [Puniceicoccaceae bacterium]